MNLEEFESRYREAIDETLNELQTLTLLVVQLENRIAAVGHSLQSLSQKVEEFISQQRSE